MSVGISKGHNGDLTRDGSLIKKCLWRQGERSRKFGGGNADVLFKRLLRKCGGDVAEFKVNENRLTGKHEINEAVIVQMVESEKNSIII